MTRFILSLLVAISCGLAGPRAQGPDQKPTGGLSIDIVAIDRKGEPVRDLKAGDLEVWIGHYRAPIRTVTVVFPIAGKPQTGRLIVLLMDDVTIAPAMVPRAREAAMRFVSKAEPADRIVLTTLTGTTMDVTGDPASLRRALDAYNVRASGFDRADVLGQHMLSSLTRLAEELRETPGVRKTIVAIGSARLFDTPLPPPGLGRDVEPQWTAAMRALAFAHMHLYVIDPSGVGGGPADSGTFGFARATGGHAFINTNDMTGAADRILGDASNYYVLSVPDPPVGRNSNLREVEVRVRRPGVTILAPRAIPGRMEGSS